MGIEVDIDDCFRGDLSP